MFRFWKCILFPIVLLWAVSCSTGPSPNPNPPDDRLAQFHAELTKMGYTGYPNPSGKAESWVIPEKPHQEEPEVKIYKDDQGVWRVGFIDFEDFWCRIIDVTLTPEEAVKRSKNILSQVPPEQRAKHPADPRILKDGLDCNIGKGG